MQCKDIQGVVKGFNNENNLNLDIMARSLDLGSEVGELQKEILLGTNYGSKSFKPTDNFKNEIGDCFYSLLSLCNEAGINLEGCLVDSLTKMKIRIEGGK